MRAGNNWRFVYLILKSIQVSNSVIETTSSTTTTTISTTTTKGLKQRIYPYAA